MPPLSCIAQVSYADVFNCAKGVVEGPPHKLLESVAHAIARKILDAYERVESVRVAVNKTHIPNLSAAVMSVGEYPVGCARRPRTICQEATNHMPGGRGVNHKTAVLICNMRTYL